MSQNLGLPDFKQLVQFMAADLGFSAGNYHVSDYAVIAKAYLVKHAQLGALRSWMDTTWHPANIEIRTSELHNLIVDLDFCTIYTTNYDRWLEMSFDARRKPYHKITNAADLTSQRGSTDSSARRRAGPSHDAVPAQPAWRGEARTAAAEVRRPALARQA